MVFFAKTLALRDTFFEFRFLYDFAKENILNGIIPLWNPYSSCGQPFIANPQAAFFYPFTWIYYLLDFHPAYTLYIFIHLLLAGISMYAFLRPVLKDSWISFLGGVVYMLNGLLISRVEFLSEFASIAWIPLILALLRTTIASPSGRSSALLGTAIAIQFLAGHTQTFYYTTLVGFFFTVFLFGVDYRREKKISAARQPAKYLIVAGLLAFLIVMIQLAPTYELFTQTKRSLTDYDARTGLASLHPVHALTLLFPYLFGWPGYQSYWGSTYEFWASSFYAGVQPLIFFLLAVLLFAIARKDRSVIALREGNYFVFFMGCFGVAWVIALGDYSPVFGLIHDHLPGFDKFRWPSSSLLLCTLSMSVMAPLGLNWILNFTRSRRQSNRIWIRMILGTLVIGSAAIGLGMNLSPDIAAQIVKAITPTPGEALQDFRGMVENILGTSILPDKNRMVQMGYSLLFNMAFVLIAGIVLWIRLRGKIKRQHLIACIIICTAVDLIGNAQMGVAFFNKSVNTEKATIVDSIPQAERHNRLMARTDVYQQYTYGTRESSTLLLGLDGLTGEVGLAQKLFRIHGKGVLEIKNYSDFSGFKNIPFALQIKFIKFLNVKYLLQLQSPLIPQSASLELDPKIRDDFQTAAALNSEPWSVRMAAIKETMPRIFVVSRFRVMKSDTEDEKNIVFRRFVEDSFDFADTVIVDEPIDGMTPEPQVHFTIRQAASYKNPNQVQAVIETDSDGIAVLSDVYYPGWELFVNGSKQKIYRANTTFRAGVLKAGVNHILFNYNPKSFKVGCILSIAGIMLLIGLVVIHLRALKASGSVNP